MQFDVKARPFRAWGMGWTSTEGVALGCHILGFQPVTLGGDKAGPSLQFAYFQALALTEWPTDCILQFACEAFLAFSSSFCSRHWLCSILVWKKEWFMSTTRITTTRIEGWQGICRTWAAAGESFEIHGIGASHLAFCKELCEAFNYECHYQSHDYDSAAVFAPLN
jgi:hypothetical protein